MKEERVEILKIILRECDLNDDVDLEVIAD